MPLNRQIKIRQILLCVHVRMAIPYLTAKFNSNNGVKNVVLGQTAKFNDRQYFQLYGISLQALMKFYDTLMQAVLRYVRFDGK